jgi:HEPN domain-containing protein
MKPREEVIRQIVGQWIDKAEQDFNAAETLFAGKHPLLYPVCFHAQQTVEKFLKACLTRHQIEFPKTHSIAQLLNLVESTDAALSETLKGAIALTTYGVDIRYPGDYPEPSRSETENALVLARNIRQTILKSLPDFP